MDKPSIKTGYFTSGEDLAVMRTGIRMCRKIAQSSVFDKYRGEEIYPGPSVQSNADLDQYIRNVSSTARDCVVCDQPHFDHVVIL
jgi:choline dehydrogenase-like flavoprotein